MSDYSSELPVRSQLPGQVAPDDIIVKLGDASNPTTQLAKVDTHGSVYNVNADSAGNLIGDQHLSSTWWLQMVMPSNGPATNGTAALFSGLAGGIYNSATGLTIPLTAGQQAALQLDAAGRLLVEATLDYDTNWGVVGATTLRVAAEIGNATGAANFNYGAINGQSLQTAAQLGNATGAVNYNYGAVTAQTLQVAAQLGNAAGAIDYNYGTVDAQTIRVAAQIGNATGAADFGAGATDAQTLRVTANQGLPNTNANAWPIVITSGGTVNSPTNPVYVSSDSTPGTTIDDFKQAVAIAVNASDTHFYTVSAGKNLYFDQVVAAASGLAKMLIGVETGVGTGIFTTKFVQFNSTADASMDLTLASPIIVAAGVRVEVIVTNLDKGAQDLYSTICGYEI
jgi:hypothetical protein